MQRGLKAPSPVSGSGGHTGRLSAARKGLSPEPDPLHQSWDVQACCLEVRPQCSVQQPELRHEPRPWGTTQYPPEKSAHTLVTRDPHRPGIVINPSPHTA